MILGRYGPAAVAAAAAAAWMMSHCHGYLSPQPPCSNSLGLFTLAYIWQLRVIRHCN